MFQISVCNDRLTSLQKALMNEHDDDLEPEVEEGAEIEREEFPILGDKETDSLDVDPDELDIDPDESEL
jgi:hypothetical protein